MTPLRASYDGRCAQIASTIGTSDTHNILKRVQSLVESGEPGEEIMRRLNPPARKPEKPTGWFVGDSGQTIAEYAVVIAVTTAALIGTMLILGAIDLHRGPRPVPALERRGCARDEHFANSRPCLMTFTHGTLTGVSWYDTRRERDNALRRRF